MQCLIYWHSIIDYSRTAFHEHHSTPLDIHLARHTLLEIARSHVGAPSIRYSDPMHGVCPYAGFDCSGFVYHCIRTLRELFPTILLPNTRHANEQFDHLGVFVHPEHTLPGDVVFFSRNGSMPTHVGIVYAKDPNHPTTMIHAPGIPDTVVEIAYLEEGSIPITGTTGAIYVRNPIGYKRLTHRPASVHPRYQIPIP